MPNLHDIQEIAREAAQIIQGVYSTAFAVEFKGDDDPVTEADRRANDLICRRLKGLWPEIPIVAEESGPETYEGFRNADRIFFVDPLDGTRDFVQRTGEFAVMIGLVEGGRPTLGVLYSPVLDITWAGQVGVEAYRIDREGTRTPLGVSGHQTLEGARGVLSRAHRTAELEARSKRLGLQVTTLGSMGLRCMKVAAGEVECHYAMPPHAGNLWDACAPEAIVRAAGGTVTDEWGHPINYRGEIANLHGFLASNGRLHTQLTERLTRARYGE